MILHGRNLIISANGAVLAGAKSCDIQVECDDIPVSSPDDGAWEHVIAGMKSWKVSTSHLVGIDMVPSHKILAVGTSHKDGEYQEGNSYYIIDGTRYTGGTRGLRMDVYEWYAGIHGSRWIQVYGDTYDTYINIDNCADMVNALNNIVPGGDLVVITSFDAFGINSALASAMSTKLGIPLAMIPVVNPGIRASFAAIAIAGSTGIAHSVLKEGSQAHAELMLAYNRTVISPTPVKDILTKPGTIFNLQMQVDGLGYDRLSGNALCKQARVVGTLGNLISGSFSFKGNGPLG